MGTVVKFNGEINDIKVDEAKGYLLVVGEGNMPLVFDLKKETMRYPKEGHSSGIASCSWSQDSSYFCTSGKDGNLNIYKTEDLSLVKRLKIGKEIKDDMITHQAKFDQDGNLYLPGNESLRVVKSSSWDLEYVTGAKCDGVISSVDVLSNGIVVMVSDNMVSIWNPVARTIQGKHESEGKITETRTLGDELYLIDEDGNFCKVACQREEAQSGKMEEEQVEVSEPEPEPAMEQKVELSEPVMEKEEEKSEKLNIQEFRELEAEEEEEQIEYDDGVRHLAPVHKNNKDEKREHHKKYQELKATAMEEEDPKPEPVMAKRKNILVDEEEEELVFKNDNFAEEEEEEEMHFPKIVSYKKRVTPSEEGQKAFNVNSTSLDGSRNYMTWNMAGKVTIRKNGNIDEIGVEEYIDIEYSLGSLNKRSIPNLSKYSMASLNFRGVLLASQGYILREDEYEDDEMDEDMKKAKIMFLPSKSDKSKWEAKLSPKENIKAVVQGNFFSCVYTSKNFIRFFSPEGKEYFILGARGVITMAAYDNVLAILYHGSSPFSGNQNVFVKLFNTSTLGAISDSPVIISNGSTVKWFGFSNQGNLFVQDSDNVLWTLIGRESWSPVLESSLWVVGIDSNQVYGVKLGYDETEPNPLANHMPKTYSLKVPLSSPEYQSLSIGIMQREQLKFRNDIWGHMAQCSIQTPEDHERAAMPDQSAINRNKVKQDKEKINLCRVRLLEGKEDEALWLALQIESDKAFEGCCKLISMLNKPMFLERLRDTYQKLGSKHFFDSERRGEGFSSRPFRDITEVRSTLKLIRWIKNWRAGSMLLKGTRSMWRSLGLRARGLTEDPSRV